MKGTQAHLDVVKSHVSQDLCSGSYSISPKCRHLVVSTEGMLKSECVCLLSRFWIERHCRFSQGIFMASSEYLSLYLDISFWDMKGGLWPVHSL